MRRSAAFKSNDAIRPPAQVRTMASKRPTSEAQLHRKWAADLFNRVWTLLLRKKRTLEEIDEMIHAAHASRYHWSKVGKPKHFAIGEWQISRVYAVLRRPEPALWHAKRALEICEKHRVGDFPLAFAHEALARAYAVAGRTRDVRKHLRLAGQTAMQIKEPEDRELLLRDLASIARLRSR